jgi:hypothetical protein
MDFLTLDEAPGPFRYRVTQSSYRRNQTQTRHLSRQRQKLRKTHVAPGLVPRLAGGARPGAASDGHGPVAKTDGAGQWRAVVRNDKCEFLAAARCVENWLYTTRKFDGAPAFKDRGLSEGGRVLQ